MLLTANDIYLHINGDEGDETDPLAIIPYLDIESLSGNASTSIDLRLGRWFLMLRQARVPVLDVGKDKDAGGMQNKIGRYVFVPYGESFILHPHNFVLGATLEWVRLPAGMSGYLTGKSSWARRGLVIEAAAGVHPGFAGCLTLELSNIGEIPVRLRPGIDICQLFLHKTTLTGRIQRGRFVCKRRPTISEIELDKYGKILTGN